MCASRSILATRSDRRRPALRRIAALLSSALALAAFAATPPPAPAPQPAPATPAQEVAKRPAEGPAPEVVVVGEPAFDFGRVWAGDGLKHSFTLKNSGKAELQILRIQPG